MEFLRQKNVWGAIAATVGAIAITSALLYWHAKQRQWCVQFTSSGGQEVTYSRGCGNPQRYKTWTVTADLGEL